jgi:hypothetical protein
MAGVGTWKEVWGWAQAACIEYLQKKNFVQDQILRSFYLAHYFKDKWMVSPSTEWCRC